MNEFPSPKAFNNEGVQFAWDATSLKSANKCPRYYKYKHIEGWQPKVKSVHLIFGGWYAKALENFHKHIAAGIARETAINLIIRGALIDTWVFEKDEEGNRIDDSGVPWITENTAKTRENLVRTIVWYLEEWKQDVLETYITEEGKAAVEFTFKLPVDNGIVFAGHIDQLVQDPEGRIFVKDQKTTKGALSPSYFKDFKLDTQMTMYTFAGEMIYNIPVKGILIDAAQIMVGFSRFARAPVLYIDDELEEWYEETMTAIALIQNYTKENYFPRDFTNCGNFFGCEFKDICGLSPSNRDNFLRADFVQEARWDPLTER